MLRSFLHIRLIQIKREVLALNWYYWILLIIAVISTVGSSIYVVFQPPLHLYILPIYSLTFFYIHVKRKDKHFISLCSDYAALIMFGEYISFSIPFLIGYLLSSFWYFVIPYFIVLFLISKLKISTNYNSGFLPIRKLVPPFCFEWKSGIRKQSVFLILLYSCAIIFSYYTITLPLALFLFTVIHTEFFEECEPLNMLVVFELAPHRFLKFKLIQNLIVYLKLVSPFVILFLVIHSEIWYVIMIFLILGIIIHIHAFLAKYASYEPQALVTQNKILNAIAFVSFLIPFMVPVPLIACFRFYKSSIKTLKPYLDAYN